MKKQIRMVVINPETKTITEVMMEPTLSNYYATICCQLVEASYPRGLAAKDSFFYIDEEGRLSDNYYFTFEGQEYAGTAIIIGGMFDEEESETTVTVEEVEKQVEWTGEKEEGYGVFIEIY